MKDQLLKFLQAENISATRLADDIGVQRSGISHILSGRNKPSYDFIEKMLEKYPNLDAGWLITGKGSMYRTISQVSNPKNPVMPASQDLFSQVNNRQEPPLVKEEKKDTVILPKSGINEKNNHVTTVNKLEKIVFFYSNGEFKEYHPHGSDI